MGVQENGVYRASLELHTQTFGITMAGASQRNPAWAEEQGQRIGRFEQRQRFNLQLAVRTSRAVAEH